MGSSDKDPFLTLGLSESEKLELPTQIAAWTLEPELASPVPRRVVLKIGKVFFYAIFALVISAIFFLTMWKAWEWSSDRLFRVVFLCGWFALGVLFFYAARWDLQLSKLLVRWGATTRGTITACEYGSNEAGTWATCSVAYDTPARHFLTCDLDEGTKVGDTVTILYLPEAPDKAKPYVSCDYKAVLVSEECR